MRFYKLVRNILKTFDSMTNFRPTSSEKRAVNTSTLRRGDLVGRFFPTTPSRLSPMASEPHSRDDAGKLDEGGGPIYRHMLERQTEAIINDYRWRFLQFLRARFNSLLCSALLVCASCATTHKEHIYVIPCHDGYDYVTIYERQN